MKISPLADIIVGTTPLENELFDVRPRLYATAERFADLKDRLSHQPWATMFQKVLGGAESAIRRGFPPPSQGAGGDLRGIGESIFTLALAWRLTGDKKYLDGAVQFLQTLLLYDDWGTSLTFGHWGFGAGVCFDWLYGELGDDLRERAGEHLRRQAERMFGAWGTYSLSTGICYAFNHMAVPLGGLTALGCALYGEQPHVGPLLRMALEKARLLTESLGPDGASQEGLNYGGYFLTYALRALTLVEQLLGVDLITPCEFFRNTPKFYLYSALPRSAWKTDHVFLHFGDAHRSNWAPAPECLLATRFQDGYAQWLASETERHAGTAKSGSHMNLFWYDPELKSTPPDDLPTLHHFSDKGLVVMRSGWDGHENVFAFKCGPHSGHKALERYHHEIGGGHMHPDAGTFQLFAYGEHLIGDDGYAAKFTDQQNTILINGTGQSGEGGDWFEGVHIRRERRWPRIACVRPSAEVDYVLGDATNAYPLYLGLRRFLRHVLFVKPDFWAIIDELESEQPSTFELYFHSFAPFVAEGQAAFRLAGTKGSLAIQCLHPQGVVGRAFTQTIRMGTIPAPERQMEALVISNREPARRALFVTILHAYPTSSEPRASWVVEQDEEGKRLVLSREGTQRCFSMLLSRASSDEPIIREVGDRNA